MLIWLSRPRRILFPFLVFALVAPSLLFAQPKNDSVRIGGNGRGTPSQGESMKSTRLFDSKLTVSQPRARRVQGVNSTDRDNNPIISADGTVMFFNSTRRGDRAWASFNPFKKRYDDDIYFSVRTMIRLDDESWGEPVNIGQRLNSSEDDGVVAISPDGQTLYFNSLKKGWENDGGPFYYARLRGREWADIAGLGGGIAEFFRGRQRGSGFRVYGGSISSDGNDFYFATTLFSASGKHQIWVSHRHNDQWSFPENIGPVVNDGFGSYAPCIAADGRTLFYASSAPRGLGGDDIYVTALEKGNWSAPVNIGDPVNSKDDNSFLTLPASGDRVYFSVTIEGDEDIYMAPLPKVMRPKNVVLLAGNVVDKMTGLPLEATITIEDLATGAQIFKANSNATEGGYTTVLQAGRDYGISISAPGYLFLSDRYTIPTTAEYTEYRQDFPLEKLQRGESFVVNNIFFDYDQATLTPASRPELERIIALMREHPSLQIEVHGHTDNVGSADYNYKLSLKRAEAVREYLTEYGCLDEDRVAVRGFGFKKPIATNRTEEGRHQNRRSEFTVISM